MFVKFFICLFKLDLFIIENVQALLVFGLFKLNELVREHIIELVREQNIFNQTNKLKN